MKSIGIYFSHKYLIHKLFCMEIGNGKRGNINLNKCRKQNTGKCINITDIKLYKFRIFFLILNINY